jgi:hypothetical protein
MMGRTWIRSLFERPLTRPVVWSPPTLVCHYCRVVDSDHRIAHARDPGRLGIRAANERIGQREERLMNGSGFAPWP